ncbi:hypothetical protein ACLB1O_17895 [Escherichia coli]
MSLKKAFISNIWPRWRMKRIIRRKLINRKKFFRNWLKKRSLYNSQKLSLDKLEDLYKTLYQRTQELSLSGINADAVLYDPAVPAVKPS